MKKLKFISVLFCFIFIIFSCEKKSLKFSNVTYIDESRPKTQIILGFSQIGTESSWRIRNTKSIMDAAKEHGIQVVYDDAHQKQANQLKAIRRFIVYQVDVIAFAPVVEDGWDNVLQEAKDARIPVIIVDRKIKTKNPDLYAGFIGEDSYAEGKKAAEFLLEKYENQNKKLKILEIKGTSNSSVAKERSRGFRDVIKKDNRFEIIYSEDGDFLRSRGKEIINRILNDSKELIFNGTYIDIIFSHNDAMTLGVLEAFDENKIDIKDKVCIVSIDGEQKSINALKEGKINCVVECNPNLGQDLMNLVKVIYNRNTIPKETYVDGSVFKESDDFTKIQDRGY